jgi:2-polyprenyl-6-methoxyphenol hydroxylase-like FAD-dependent oxidoreductase
MRVAIAGAGPAGAALAYLFARRGVEVTLVERQSDFAREFRGEGLMPGGVDALRQMGLSTQLDALPQARIARLEVFLNGRRELVLDLDSLPAETALPRFVAQPPLLEMLVAQAAKFPGFELLRGVSVRDLVTAGDRIAGMRVESAEGMRELQADYVIGCDGRASVVRKRSGLDRPREAQCFDVVWCKLPLPEFMRGVVRGCIGRGHFAICFESPDGGLQLGWAIEKGVGDIRRGGIEHWIGELVANVPGDLAAWIRTHAGSVSSPFLLDVVCDHLDVWSAPGVLLLGDAAHPMSPVGAQGINIALRDAVVAANQLGPALLRGASAAELDAAALRAVVERLPEVKQIQKLQAVPPRMCCSRAARAFRDARDRSLRHAQRNLAPAAGARVPALRARHDEGVARVLKTVSRESRGYGSPAPATSTRTYSIRPLREATHFSGSESPAVQMKSVLRSGPPSMQA